MGRKNRHKHNGGNPSSKNESTDTAELRTISDTKTKDQKELQHSKENSVKMVSTCEEDAANSATPSIATEAVCPHQDTQKWLETDIRSKISPSNVSEDIQGLVNLWFDIIVESSNKFHPTVTSPNTSSKDCESDTTNSEPYSNQNASSAFTESMCCEAAKWLYSAWTNPYQQNEYTRPPAFEIADVMIYVDIIVQSWNTHIQVRNIYNI